MKLREALAKVPDPRAHNMAVNSVRVGEGDLSAVAYLGERFEVYLESPWGEVLAYVPPEVRPQAGESVPFRVAWATAYPA